jgi:hypothetical protein
MFQNPAQEWSETAAHGRRVDVLDGRVGVLDGRVGVLDR